MMLALGDEGPTRERQGLAGMPGGLRRPTSAAAEPEPTAAGGDGEEFIEGSGGFRRAERSRPSTPRTAPGASPEVEIARIRAALAGLDVPESAIDRAAPSRLSTPSRPAEPSSISAAGTDASDGGARSLAPPAPGATAESPAGGRAVSTGPLRRRGFGGAGQDLVGGGLAVPGGAAGGEATPSGLLLELMRKMGRGPGR